MADKLFHDLVTLFVVVNSIGVVPLFVAVADIKLRRKSERSDWRTGVSSRNNLQLKAF